MQQILKEIHVHYTIIDKYGNQWTITARTLCLAIQALKYFQEESK